HCESPRELSARPPPATRHGLFQPQGPPCAMGAGSGGRDRVNRVARSINYLARKSKSFAEIVIISSASLLEGGTAMNQLILSHLVDSPVIWLLIAAVLLLIVSQFVKH